MLNENKMTMYESMNGGQSAWVKVFEAKDATEAEAVAAALRKRIDNQCKVDFETCVMVQRPNLPSDWIVKQAVESVRSC